MTCYPVNLVVEGRRCLVVGGGSVAARKAAALVACGAYVTVLAPEFVSELASMAGIFSVERRPYRPGDAADFDLVVAATDDAALNRVVSQEAQAAGVWVNVADDPALCSFTLPSVLRRGPLMVTVSTGGHSPAVSAWLRRRIESEIGDEYRQLVELVSEEREAILASGRSTQGLDWQRALDSNMLELIRDGQLGKARERLQACL